MYLLTGVSFLRERTGGTLERLMATPVTRGEIVAGYTLGFGLFATVQVALLLAWALGSVAGAVDRAAARRSRSASGSTSPAARCSRILVVLLLALGAVSLGIFLSTFARTELQVIQFIPLVLVAAVPAVGRAVPGRTLPAVLQPLVAADAADLRGRRAARRCSSRGADLASAAVQLDLAVLAAIAVFFAVVASLTIRRDVV